jgi:predicted GNAT superfamily acetyltransferase
MEQENLPLAREWRVATRTAFTAALKSGFIVKEFCRTIRGQQGPGAYLLEKPAT